MIFIGLARLRNERGIVSKKKIRYLGLPVSGYRYKNLFKMITSIFFAIISTIISIFLILKIRPKLILGMGGYVSGPIGLAAVLSRTKLVIHEQNAIPGFTTKFSRFAQKCLKVSRHFQARGHHLFRKPCSKRNLVGQ